MACRNFRAIALVNAVMFATANGSRAVLMPLLAVQGFGMKTTYLGGESCLCSPHLLRDGELPVWDMRFGLP